MNFYSEFSKYYDLVFPLSSATLEFLKERAGKESAVLDIACGTGTYTLALSPYVREITGIDLDKRMIETAEEKMKEKGRENVRFAPGDMTDLNIFPDNHFGLIFCIGNSLPHLGTRKDVEIFFHEVYKKLKSGGKLIVQTINFEKILKNQETGLPTIEGEGVTFVRNYSYDTHKNPEDIESVSFDTELKIMEKGSSEEKIFTNSVGLLTLTSDELEKYAESFREIKFYGKFDGTEFDKDKSVPVIMKAVKP